MIQKLINKCNEEIEWTQTCIDEMSESMDGYGDMAGYSEEEKIWFPYWLKAHKEMLKFIKEKENSYDKV